MEGGRRGREPAVARVLGQAPVSELRSFRSRRCRILHLHLGLLRNFQNLPLLLELVREQGQVKEQVTTKGTRQSYQTRPLRLFRTRLRIPLQPALAQAPRLPLQNFRNRRNLH